MIQVVQVVQLVSPRNGKDLLCHRLAHPPQRASCPEACLATAFLEDGVEKAICAESFSRTSLLDLSSRID